MQYEIVYRPYRIFIDGDGKKYVKKKGKKHYFRKRAPVKKIKRVYNDKVNVDKSFSNYVGYLKGNILQNQLTQTLTNKGNIGQQSIGDIINVYGQVKKDLDEKLDKTKKDIMNDISKLVDESKIEESKANIKVPGLKEEIKKDVKEVIEEERKEHRAEIAQILDFNPPTQTVNETQQTINFEEKEYIPKVNKKTSENNLLVIVRKIDELNKKYGRNFIFDENEYKEAYKLNDIEKKKELLLKIIKDAVKNNHIYLAYEGKGAGKKWSGKRWGGLYNTEIDFMLKPIAHAINYYGTICLDEIPKLLNKIHTKKFSFIYNTAKTNDISSVQHHWIAVYCDGISIEVYNCLADPIQPFVKKCLKIFAIKNNLYERFKFNKIKNQGNSSNCGFFAIKFLIGRGIWKVRFEKITGFKSIKKNEENIENLKENYEDFGFI